MRRELERFINTRKQFKTALVPVLPFPSRAPSFIEEMHNASLAANVGPMAAVAGIFAQKAGEKVLETGCKESIIENGGDIFLSLANDLVLGIYAGGTPFENTLAFKIKPEQTPLAICSSSATMGHSLSFGTCNLATVFSSSGALADAAATRACNLVKTEDDIDKTLEYIMKINGIRGIMIVKNDKIGIAGDLPELVRNVDPDLKNKITRDEKSNFC